MQIRPKRGPFTRGRLKKGLFFYRHVVFCCVCRVVFVRRVLINFTNVAACLLFVPTPWKSKHFAVCVFSIVKGSEDKQRRIFGIVCVCGGGKFVAFTWKRFSLRQKAASGLKSRVNIESDPWIFSVISFVCAWNENDLFLREQTAT